MAVLEKIRSKAGILVASVIGLSLLAFILGDFLDSRKSIFRSSKSDIAEVFGHKVPVQEYERMVNELTGIVKFQSRREAIDDKTVDGIREQTWQQLINQEMMSKQFDKIGLVVSADELNDLIQGNNPSPMIRQIFSDPQTGSFNKAELMQFLKGTNDNIGATDQGRFRLYLEDQIVNQRINIKYNTLISKGLQAPSFMLKNDINENGKKVDFNYVLLRYNTISDSAVKLSDSELKDYYNSHKYLYDQTESRDMEYVSFDILPSKADRANALEYVSKLKPDFISTNEVEQFVNSNSESDAPYNDKAYKPGQLSDSLNNFMFSASVGDVYGPYLENDRYKLAKLYKIVNIPDSVKARHILIVPKEKTEEAIKAAKALADSLKNVIEKDKKADFTRLATQFSEDKGSAAKGGDLGWFKEGAMVKPFNDAAFESKKGETKMVESQFGYHILQVTDKGKDVKKIKVAIVEHRIEPSKATYDQTFAAANKFASENQTQDQFNAAVAKQNLSKRIANNIGKNDKALSGLDQARQLVKWVYSTDKSIVSAPFAIGDKYIVGVVTEIREKGTAPLKQVRADVELAVRKQKKAEKLIATFKQAQSGARLLQDIALKVKSPLETATNVNFAAFSVPGAGIEPKLIGLATTCAKNKISEPIDGNNGVYVISVINSVEDPAGKDINIAKQRMNSAFMSRSYDAYNALKKLAEIEDYRSDFY